MSRSARISSEDTPTRQPIPTPRAWATKVTLRLPTGGQLGLDWEYGRRWTDGVSSQPRYGSGLTFTFTQPLLRGAGMRVNTAPVRIARLGEKIGVLALRQTVIDIASSVVTRYRDYVQAERRVDIRAGSLQRARDLREVNELLVRTGAHGGTRHRAGGTRSSQGASCG